MYIHNPSIWKVESGRSGVQGQPHNELKSQPELHETVKQKEERERKGRNDGREGGGQEGRKLNPIIKYTNRLSQ